MKKEFKNLNADKGKKKGERIFPVTGNKPNKKGQGNVVQVNY